MKEPYEVISRERTRLVRHSKKRKRIPKKRTRVLINIPLVLDGTLPGLGKKKSRVRID